MAVNRRLLLVLGPGHPNAKGRYGNRDIPQEGALASMNTALLDELMAYERRFWESASDLSLYQSVFAEDGLAVFAMQDGLMDKTKILASISNGEQWASYRLANVQLVSLGADSAAIVYEASGDRPGRDQYRAFIVSTYRRDGDGWKLVIHQQSPVPQEQLA
jgi:ketosteroid isomerase-like protein